MRVIMFDRQSLFIHGAIHSLQRLIPEINITGTCQAEDLWTQISASPSAIVMIDGNLIQDEGSTLLFSRRVGQRADVASGIIILERAPARSLEIAGGGGVE